MSELGDASPIKKNHKGKLSKRQYTALLLVLLAVISIIAFGTFWSNNAFSLTSNTQEQNEIASTTSLPTFFTSHLTSTFTIENYFPFRSYNFVPEVVDYSSTDETSREITNLPGELQAENISINYVEVQWFYGQEAVQAPQRVNNPDCFIGGTSVPMAKTVITYDWQYNTTFTPSSIHTIVLYLQGQYIGGKPSSFNMVEAILMNFSDTIYYLVFLAIGFTLSWLLFRNKCNFKSSYKFLTNTFPKEQEKLESNLENLSAFQNQIGTLERINLGLSLIFLKTSITNWCKRHVSGLTIGNNKKVRQLFSKLSENSSVQLSDLVPDLRYVLIGLGFLASIGISFSWNSGALAPFLLSIGIFYFFVNIGSAFYLLKESRKDLLWTLAILIIALLVVLFPEIIASLRRLTSEGF